MSDGLSAERPLLLVGCGNMGLALLKGWLAAGTTPEHIHVIEPGDPSRVLAAGVLPGQLWTAAPAGLTPRVVLMAVKPQLMADALPPLAPLIGADTLLLSIAAGTTLARLAALSGGHRRVVRAMPNTPAAIGQGATVMVADAGVTPADRALADRLMAAAGNSYWIDDEALMDVVTALSGSGPAYVFHLIETLGAAGAALGLPADLAANLARDTVAGAGALARQSGEDPAQLRVQVTSPGGTTAAGLGVLMAGNGLAPLIRATLEAATQRGRELGKLAG